MPTPILTYEPATAGRSMNGHFVSRYINPDGSWRRPDRNVQRRGGCLSDRGADAARGRAGVRLAPLPRTRIACRTRRNSRINGDEVTWATIGNASTAEGLFWESVNAIGVLKAPAVISIYDDGYGISVPNQFQMVKENIGAILKGFERDASLPAEQADRGYDLYSVRAWDYPALYETYQTAAEIARIYHIPALVHVTEMTQPLGHSTSGSHERYKSTERLKWEEDFDGLRKMREWMIASDVATENEMTAWEAEDAQTVENIRKSAWEAIRRAAARRARAGAGSARQGCRQHPRHADELRGIKEGSLPSPALCAATSTCPSMKRCASCATSPTLQRIALVEWKKDEDARNETRYGSLLMLKTVLGAECAGDRAAFTPINLPL